MKMVLKEIGWEGMDCIHLVQNKGQWQDFVNTAKNLWVPQNATFFFISRASLSFARRTVLHQSEFV
jgi:hypothetical protein